MSTTPIINAFLGATRVGYVGLNPVYNKYRLNISLSSSINSSNYTASSFWVKYGLGNGSRIYTINLDALSQNRGSVEFEFDPRSTYTLQGYGTYSNTPFTTNIITINTLTPPDAPPPPSASILEIDGVPQVKLNIKPPSHWGGGTPRSYNIQYFSPQDEPPVRRFKSFNIVGGGYPDSLNYIVEGLSTDKNYVFKISATNLEVGVPSEWSLESKAIHLPSRKFTLFDRSSWNNSSLPQKIKDQFNKAADSWETYITITPDIVKILQNKFTGFEGLIGYITTFSDPDRYAMACAPSKSIKLPGGKLITFRYDIKINTALFNTLTDYDWELVITHQLGHGLGLGYKHYLNNIFSTNYSAHKIPSYGYPKYQLEGKLFSNAQDAYNKMRSPPFQNAIKGRKYIPLDHIGHVVADDVTGFDDTPSIFANDDKAKEPPQQNILNDFYHWGCVRNNYDRHTVLHPTTHINNDIMSYRYPDQNKTISLLSIKMLVDLGYSEVNPNTYQIKTEPMAETTITNKQLCSYYTLNEPVIQSTEMILLQESSVDLIINKDDIIINLEPEEIDPCAKWYCSESGCVQINSFEFFGDGTLYDSLEECEADCTDSAGVLSSQFIFDTQSKTWRNK